MDSRNCRKAKAVCVIVDADKTGELLKNPSPAESRPLLQWLMRGGVMVYSTGGVFARQFPQANIDQLVKLFQNRQLRAIPPEKVREKMRNLPKKLRSDRKKGPGDRHILALALASRAEVLYTGDKDLMDDFRDRKVMGELRGKIYSGPKSRGLLRPDICKNC